MAEIVNATLHPPAPAPGFAIQPREHARPVALPAWFIDRCRQAFLAISFPVGARILGITSAAPGQGKSTVALGIATAIAADTGEPTILLGCDLETPSDELFGVSAGPGLGEWLAGDDTLRILRMPPLNNAFIIPAGAARPDGARVFYRLTQSNLLDELQSDFPNIIIDLPPMLSIAYSSLAAKITERIILVARYGITRMQEIEEAVYLLGHDRISGVIINGYSPRTPAWLRRLM